MPPTHRYIFDDLSRVAGSAVNIVSSLRLQIKNEVQARIDEYATKMDLVPRSDLNDLEILVSNLQRQQDALEKRIKEIEKS